MKRVVSLMVGFFLVSLLIVGACMPVAPGGSTGGSCCLPDGSCQNTNSADCAQSGGSFLDGQDCSLVDCAQSDGQGACCFSNGTCLATDEAVCEAGNGTYSEGAACETIVCEPAGPAAGACCLSDDNCLDSDSEECASINGTLLEGSSCADGPCGSDETGACCLTDAACFETDAVECASVDGTFSAAFTCAELNCPRPGACCLVEDGTCVDSDSNACMTVNATFREGETCSEVSCPQPELVIRACCLLDGSCDDASEADCAASGGSFDESITCAQAMCPAATASYLRDQAEELESIMREGLDSYIKTVSIVGREYWDLNGADPQYTGELMGKSGGTLSADSTLVTESFAARYRAIRHAQNLIDAAAGATLTDEERNGINGYAKTLQAYALLLVANRQFSNGILPVSALDSADPSSAFIDYTSSLQNIADLLDEAATNLTNGGSSFIFSLSGGFNGFNTPATFRQFNRALTARVRIYQGDKSGSISGIAGSFFNINGSMDTGPQHIYGIELRNPLYFEPDEDLITAHPDFIADAEAGDLRLSGKTRAYVASADLTVPVSFDSLTGDTQVNVVASNTDPFSLIRNEELILIYAEAQIGSDVNEVLAAVNRVRNASGLGNYLGATDDASLLNEVLHQRRYSLFGEGHRWIDLRRTGKIGQVNVDRVGDVVHQEFPRPGSATLAAL